MKKAGPYNVYLFTTAVSTFLFSTAFTTSAIYRIQMAGLNPFELVLLGTVLEGSVFLFEIPTGIVADLVSRRLSVIIGYALIGLGLFLEGSLQFFATILLAQAVWGIGYTFISGAQGAWLADELGEDRLAPTYLRGSQLSQIAAFAGIFANIALASVQLNLPLIIGGLGHILLALILIGIMPESGFKPTPQRERNTWQKMGHIFHEGLNFIKGSPLLVTIMGITFIYGLYSEPLDRLWEALLLENFAMPGYADLEPVVWFGTIKAIIMILTIATTEFIKRRESKLDYRRYIFLLAIFSGIIAAGMILFGLAPTLSLAVLAYMIVAVVRRTLIPLYDAWINRGIPSEVRATVLSTFGQMDAIGQVVGGPALGLVASRIGVRLAMVISGLLVSPTLLLYRRAQRFEPEKSTD